MSLVSEADPVEKRLRLRPFQVMLIVIASQHAVALAERPRAFLRECTQRLIETAMRFITTSPTPLGMYHFERDLAAQLRQMGLQIVQFAVNNLEPEAASDMPPRVWHGQAEFSRKGGKGSKGEKGQASNAQYEATAQLTQ